MAYLRLRALLRPAAVAAVSLVSLTGLLACTNGNASRTTPSGTPVSGSATAAAAAASAQTTAPKTAVAASPSTASASASASPAAAGTAPVAMGQVGSVSAGEQVFTQNCAVCHGTALDGNGGKFPPLLGRQTVPDFPSTTVLFDYISRSMPYSNPGSLTADQYYSVIAYLLNKNGIVPATAVVNKETLPTIKLPGADPIGPPLPGAPSQQQMVTKGSSEASPVTP